MYKMNTGMNTNKNDTSNKLQTVSADTGFYRYLHKVNQIPSLSLEEESSLSKAYIDSNDIVAAQRLVSSHLKLVAKIAMRYKNYGLPVSELVSEGNIGLMQAVKKFNPDLGFRLSTYAMWWIKAGIQEYILKSWSLVKIGTTAAQKKLFFSLGKIKNKISALYSRSVNEGDFAQIAESLSVTKKEVYEMNSRLAGQDISLNQRYNNDDNSSEFLEMIPESKSNQEVILISKQDSAIKMELLANALSNLNARELEIFKARKLNESPITLEDLSVQYGISKERVRQIENKAFQKVQHVVLNNFTN